MTLFFSFLSLTSAGLSFFLSFFLSLCVCLYFILCLFVSFVALSLSLAFLSLTSAGLSSFIVCLSFFPDVLFVSFYRCFSSVSLSFGSLCLHTPLNVDNCLFLLQFPTANAPSSVCQTPPSFHLPQKLGRRPKVYIRSHERSFLNEFIFRFRHRTLTETMTGLSKCDRIKRTANPEKDLCRDMMNGQWL